MSAPDPATWNRCRDCQATFAEPSFSEGPKVVDQETFKVVRFSQAWFMCPECLSRNIERIPA